MTATYNPAEVERLANGDEIKLLASERDRLSAEVVLMRPVVAAAEAWRGDQVFTLKTQLTDAVDAYRAKVRQ